MRARIWIWIVVLLSLLNGHSALGADNGTEPWKGNNIGISDTPPPPFTPVALTREGDTFVIACWGRIYELGPIGLPRQIRSKGADLLAYPVTLEAVSDGKEITWEKTSCKALKTNKVQVVIEGQAESAVGTLKWKCTAEYDGLLRYDLSLEPKAGASVDSLEMKFKVKPEHAQLNWRPNAFIKYHHGSLPPGEGILDQYGAEWYTWVGDQDRGLAVFFETDEAWDKPDRTDAYRIERNKDSLNVVWSFIKGRTILGKPWKYTFGVEATPVKDTQGGRKWRYASHLPVESGNFTVPWSLPKTNKYFGYPEATYPEKYSRMVRWYHQQGIKVCPYVLLNVISAASPEFSMHKEWVGDLVQKGTEGGGDVSAYGADLWGVVPTQDYIDFIVWKCDQFVRRHDLDGLYHDFTNLMVVTKVSEGFGYVRDGKEVRCYPFFERRELYKRIYTMLKQYKKDAINIGHMSWDMYLPHLAFCDIILNGEHFSSTEYRGKTYQELLPDDYIQAEFMAHNYGLTSMFLTQWSYLAPNQPIGFLLGNALLYDFVLWDGSYIQERVFRVFDEFGATKDAEFIPFWNNRDIVQGQTAEVRCSVYRKPQGGALLVFFNRSKSPQDTTFKIDWERLKSPGNLVIQDAFPVGWEELVDNDIPVDGNTMRLNVPPESFRIVRVR